MQSFEAQIDPFLGTDAPGHCLPGPFLPFSLARLGPDVEIPHACHGYSSQRKILRFTHTHVSGTGGMGRYGNVGLMPFDTLHFGSPLAMPEFGALISQDRASEEASPGAYTTTLEPSGITVELAATPHVGFHRITFAKEEGGLLFDASSIITTSLEVPEDDPNGFAPRAIGGWLKASGPASLEGEATLAGGWGHGSPYRVAFAVEFDHPIDFLRFEGQQPGWETPLACRLLFKSNRIEARVAISMSGVERARKSLEEEARITFEEARAAAALAWKTALSGFSAKGGTPAERTLFATSLYRLYCMPSDLGVRREFTQWDTDARHFSDYYCLWDSCRNANSFLDWFEPSLHADMVNCLLDVADHTGWAPDAWIAGDSAFLQGGSSLDVVLGELAAKDRAGIDWERAWRLCRRQLETPSPNPYKHGRYPAGPKGSWLPAQTPQCVSRTLEYRYQEWCLAQVAEKAGDTSGAAALRAKSQEVWDLWHPGHKAFAPREADGEWTTPFSPDHCRWDCWNDPWCYEGTSRQWSWNVLHDVPGLIDRLGGREAAVKAIVHFLEGGSCPEVEGLMPAPGYRPKETMLHVPYLLSEAGEPGLASWWVREILATRYRAERNGLPDNEDMGCQSGFVIGACLGIYPVMGQNKWWLTAPVFEEAAAPGGLRILAPGTGPEARWLTGAVLNGSRLAQPWVRHSDLMGGVLEMEVASEPGPWKA